MSDILSGDYPESWDEYMGQKRAKRRLLTASHSAALRKENLAHTLICSPVPGSGKTALAQLTIRQLTVGNPNLKFHSVTGVMNLAKVRLMFSMVQDGDVIFYDEIHKAMDSGKRHAEWMLHYLENGVLMTPFGEERVPAVTIIGTTTDKGVLPEPILQRFTVIDLEPYNEAEATQIAQTLGSKILGSAGLPVLGKDASVKVAAASLNGPRAMRKLIHAVRDLAVTDQIESPDDGEYDLVDAMDMADVTPDGLTKEMRDALRVMYVEMGCEPIGETLLKRRLGLVGKGLELVEQALQNMDLVRSTKQGRMLTGLGIRRCQGLWP